MFSLHVCTYLMCSLCLYSAVHLPKLSAQQSLSLVTVIVTVVTQMNKKPKHAGKHTTVYLEIFV